MEYIRGFCQETQKHLAHRLVHEEEVKFTPLGARQAFTASTPFSMLTVA